MTQLTTEEITQYKANFAGSLEALDALEVIQECDGNLEQAAQIIALEAGQEAVRADKNLLDEFAKKCRDIVCDEAFINDLLAGLLPSAVALLASSGQIPAALATPVVIYLTKIGIRKFCDSTASASD